ncbi:MAG TPA: calcium/sodium antiporter [Desulfobulbaceae bacterium]|nr:calcium/sodium antiporter [Desulfobulbaceae bacterium]
METGSLSLLHAVAFIIGGLLMLVGGGEALVGGATRLAERLGMKPLLIGLTVVAFGTSVPELFVSMTAAFKGYPDIMIGNVVGSNIANVGLILGCCALLAPLTLTIGEVWYELLLVSGGSVLLMLCSGYGYFPRAMGLLFVLTLAGYTILVCNNGRRARNKEVENNQNQTCNMGLPLMLGLILLGLFLLAGGSNLFIRGAVDLARHFGISELIIGLTLAAIGTSLPELASSLAALRHNESGLLIGNVIGSNMFNLFMVLGLTGLLKPFSLSSDLLHRDLPVMLAFTLVLIPILHKTGGTRRIHGVFLLGGYLLYCFSLI